MWDYPHDLGNLHIIHISSIFIIHMQDGRGSEPGTGEPDQQEPNRNGTEPAWPKPNRKAVETNRDGTEPARQKPNRKVVEPNRWGTEPFRNKPTWQKPNREPVEPNR